MNFVRRYLMTLLGIGISVVAIFWLAGRFDLAEVAATLRSADPLLMAPTPLLIVASFVLRAQRWRLVVEHKPPVRYWPSFRALMIGYLLNNLLPARAGDFARALELGRTERMSRTKVLATLVTERAVDLAITLAILSLVLLSYPALPVWLKQAGVAIAVVSAVAIGALVLAHTMGQRLVPWVHGWLSRWLPVRLGQRIEAMAFSALEGIAGMFRPSRAAGFIALTALIWVVEVLMVYLIARAAGLDLAPGNALFVLLVIAIGTMVPSSPGFIGTYEFFGVAALAIIGITGTSALAFVIVLHVTTLLGSTFIGAVCFLLRPRTVKPDAEMGKAAV